VDSLSDFVLGGGKRLRPTFAWWGWRGAGGSPTDPEAQAVLRAVSSLELIQACALVHDDLMDDSTTRRGAPTVHVDFAARHRAAGWLGTPERFGAATAILLGDIALAWADDMLRGAELWPDQLGRVHTVWQAMRTELLAGQYLDMLTQAREDETPEAALQIDRYKTAAYTVERPLHLGAAIAGAGPALVAAYRRFGADIGIAFQLRDDLLGMFGDPVVTGKPAGDDLREGKRTLLLAYGLRAADGQLHTAAAELLRGAIGDPLVDEDTVTEIRELLIEIGAVAEVERRITELTNAALRSLCAADLAEPARARLTDLAAQATCRVL
jgi:geranylgeranyl diphosphate synthase, type I